MNAHYLPTDERLKQHFDIHHLEFYRKQDARRTLVARAALLGVIIAMLGVNMLMTWSTHQAMLTNLDQARLGQVTMDEQSEARMAALSLKVDRLEQQVADLSADAGEAVAAR